MRRGAILVAFACLARVHRGPEPQPPATTATPDRGAGGQRYLRDRGVSGQDRVIARLAVVGGPAPPSSSTSNDAVAGADRRSPAGASFLVAAGGDVAVGGLGSDEGRNRVAEFDPREPGPPRTRGARRGGSRPTCSGRQRGIVPRRRPAPPCTGSIADGPARHVIAFDDEARAGLHDAGSMREPHGCTGRDGFRFEFGVDVERAASRCRSLE